MQRRWRGSSESKILEVGCGTGAHLLALVDAMGCSGWGLEPSREMIRHSSVDERVHFSEGVAENLAFEDDFFDLVFSVNVIHHVKSAIDYFREALRVLKPAGLICTVTDSERIIRRRKPLANYWSGTAEADLKRYPSIGLLRQQMTTVGFVSLEEQEIKTPFEVTDATPYREKAFSCLHLISEEEFESGLHRLEDDLKEGPVQGLSEYICLWGEAP